jgi:putative IMPACT (imprinted ancient) family translation regulator
MKIISQGGTAEQTINKSKFLAWVANCQTEQEVGAFLRAIATQHQNASHLAYAFRIKTIDGIDKSTMTEKDKKRFYKFIKEVINE